MEHQAGIEPEGLPQELGPVETVMRKMAHDPRGRSTGMAIWILDRSPDWGQLVETWDRLSRLLPRFRQRIVDPPLQLGPPRWRVDPYFDLDYHLRRVRVPEPGTLRQLLDLAKPMFMAELDPARPLWETTLVEGLEYGRAALIQKADHAMSDGQGAVRVMELLYDRTRAHQHLPMPPVPAPDDMSPTAVLRATLTERLRALPREGPRSMSHFVSTMAGMVGRPGRALSQALEVVASSRRLLMPAGAEPSPLLRSRSLSYRFDVLEVGLDDLRRAGNSAGGSLNDAYLAALAGGLRLYHQQMGVPVERVPMGIPISIRKADDPLESNRFAGAIFPAPVGVADSRLRIKQIRAHVLKARAEPALSALESIAPLLRIVPSSMVGTLMTAGAPRDIQASNLAGLREPTYMAGAELLRIYGIGPLPGCAVMVGLMSHLDACCIGVNLDPAAVTEPELFTACLRDGFEEVLALGGQHLPVLPPAAAGAPPRRAGTTSVRRPPSRTPFDAPARPVRTGAVRRAPSRTPSDAPARPVRTSPVGRTPGTTRSSNSDNG